MFTLPIDDDIKLALLGPEHAARLFELVLANRDHLSHFLAWPGLVQQQEDSRQYLCQMLGEYGEGHSLTCGVLLDNELVGMMDLRGLDARRVGVLGYWLAEAYQGRGIVTRAARGLIRYGFVQLELEKIELRCAVSNHRSQAVAERLGCELEGTLRRAELVNGHCFDHRVYGLMRNQWQSG
ncbi:GCN5-related N-acetyltransferase [Ferrimonas balearica DSM 9799]|uniref:GCN5-related N-acetyltransferase n=1 Tax=Ferrimonas balearica (strain DSM 9799 / CCM 4581 / KCTC 23876 / PAT) TaxID=550540 RepID=E1SNF1_FERBD|nr:GNAT family N-acetyltransferase [Ferrimonas balearica]ADN75635.1 GCN5-related N-acetyltransferase [Ferrimonas balearica DSM 9799]